MLSGLDRVAQLTPGTGFFDVTATAEKKWGGDMDAFIRAELGWHPTDSIEAFGFAQADTHGLEAGVGLRGRF